jgi:glycosyltransferase involved in cell wall biosynthesis
LTQNNQNKFNKMKLGIISDAQHYYSHNGKLCTLSQLSKQIEQWAELFEKVIICAPLKNGLPPSLFSSYNKKNIKILPVVEAGGNTIWAKVVLGWRLISWHFTLTKLINQVDAIHIRFPNNISILGLLLLRKSKIPVHATYTGSWKGYPSEPVTYRFQRWCLRRQLNWPVAVYEKQKSQPSNIFPTFSPSYTMLDWTNEKKHVIKKIEYLQNIKSFDRPIQLLTVGSLTKNKNQEYVIKSVKLLQENQVDYKLHIAGDGTKLNSLIGLVDKLSLNDNVFFYGNIAHSDLRKLYRKADFIVQSPIAEGFGKVPMEAFFYGAIPIISNVGISETLIGFGTRGRCFDLKKKENFIPLIIDLSSHPNKMINLIEDARKYSHQHTLEAWRGHIYNCLIKYW